MALSGRTGGGWVSVVLVSLTCALLGGGCQAHAQAPSASVDQRVDALVSQMTLEEKISQMMNTAPAIPRLGIPAYDWWSEGLHGIARSGYATMFPQAIGMAATWDTDMVGDMADVVATEARAKYQEAVRHDVRSIYYGLTIWSPNINIFRDPRWGRGQETYGEDPFLTGRLGVAFVKGLQGKDPDLYKAIATPKHFAVHSGPEAERHRFNVQPSPHDLWDTYLPAFRAAVVEGRADSVMCAYNALDGTPACGNHELLGKILRQDWGFKGYVTSDCGAVDDFYEKSAHHTSPDAATAAAEAVKAGTDTNCGGTYKALGDAVKRGLVSEGEIDVAVKRLFRARFQLGILGGSEASAPYAAVPFSEVDSAPHRALALKAADEAMVLLKNDAGALPLRSDVRTIAVVGPNAASLAALEGNYNAIPRDPEMPVDGIAAEFSHSRVVYAQGSPYVEGVPLPAPRTLFHTRAKSKAEGLTGEYFSGTDFAGAPVRTRIDKQIDFDWDAASPTPGVPMESFGVRWSGTIAPPAAGEYTFSVKLQRERGARESARVLVDGKPVLEIAPEDRQQAGQHGPPVFHISFRDTRPHPFVLEYTHAGKLFGAGIRLEWTPTPEVMRNDAVRVARRADVVVALVGLSPDLEGEEMPVHVTGFAGGDRTDITLPAAQEQLLEALAATGKPLIVVLMNGSALAVTWAQQHAAAVLEAWYPGEEGARAIAQTLSGKNNPGGRLPLTFYRSLDQLPPFEDYAMSHRTYRYFEGDPLYRFGYGLSYTHFSYTGLKLSTPSLRAGDTLTVEADVQNTGSRAGDEVVEVHLRPPQTAVSPKMALVGFKRLHLEAGQSEHVQLALDARALSQVDAEGTRAVRSGTYEVSVGGGQPERTGGMRATLAIEGETPLPR